MALPHAFPIYPTILVCTSRHYRSPGPRARSTRVPHISNFLFNSRACPKCLFIVDDHQVPRSFEKQRSFPLTRCLELRRLPPVHTLSSNDNNRTINIGKGIFPRTARYRDTSSLTCLGTGSSLDGVLAGLATESHRGPVQHFQLGLIIPSKRRQGVCTLACLASPQVRNIGTTKTCFFRSLTTGTQAFLPVAPSIQSAKSKRLPWDQHPWQDSRDVQEHLRNGSKAKP
ncbi:hypothetical protein BDP55DRAFT_130137 [Colletotrichum godetiae]|uniref:Uncharacterized protein n=1 Tax=Colletotrichum godetiae TaxID=1209918 RepID=A0AAJ0AZK7_9PEZI|nr:uncharacterized protein BDP55DRAFT_130137 [Colletotrichum godetiae]KAK1700400.1 hypothetical protein BDP55DRAFT_130137 [Colletotrichum godetiae]